MNRMDADGTLYEILQVRQDADQEAIEAAYKRLAFKYHRTTPIGAATAAPVYRRSIAPTMS